ncbi:hypothetical protein AGDE_12688 [Angomonas deanei]|nr:hypothetical protein AGDE_12688 [Angomonas deanei]|eukprot:EPY23995.1 hypothetical protein AGDE_12688 [Angomonas deanei]
MNKSKRDGDTTGGGTDGCFPFLCRALRAENLPYLSTLDLSGNRLPLRSLLTLVDQVTCQLRTLQLSYTSISNDRKERASLLTGIMRRQQRHTSLSHLEEEGTSNAPFAHLDVYLVSSLTSDNIHKNSAMTVDTEWPTTLECVKWLSRQTAVQLIR